MIKNVNAFCILKNDSDSHIHVRFTFPPATTIDFLPTLHDAVTVLLVPIAQALALLSMGVNV